MQPRQNCFKDPIYVILLNGYNCRHCRTVYHFRDAFQGAAEMIRSPINRI